jgi:hypothetical protein
MNAFFLLFYEQDSSYIHCNGIRCRGGVGMLVVEENSVYEIDEECLKTRQVPPACGVYEKIRKEEKQITKRTNEAMGGQDRS